MAATAWRRPAGGEGQAAAPHRHHHRRQRRDVHVPVGHGSGAEDLGRGQGQRGQEQESELLGLRGPRQGDEPDRRGLPADPVVVRRRRLRLQLERDDRQRGVAESGQVPGAGPEGGSPARLGEHRCGRPLATHGYWPGVPINGVAGRDHRDRRELDRLTGEGQGQLHPDAGGAQREGHRHDG